MEYVLGDRFKVGRQACGFTGEAAVGIREER